MGPLTHTPQPLARATLIRVIAAATLIMGLAAAIIFMTVAQDREAIVVRSVGDYASARARDQERIFGVIARFHRKAEQDFRARLSRGSDEEVARAFNRLFPLAGDGTRRSIPGLFDGTKLSSGEEVRGIGSFMAAGRDLSARDKRVLLAAFHTVRTLGPGIEVVVDNFSFFDPQNRLIVYAPHRPDRLMFYRKHAPPDFGFRSQDFVQQTLRRTNPGRELRCTGLVRTLYDPTGRTWTSGCNTPVDVDGRQVGLWGSTLLLDALVERIAASRLPHTTVLLVTQDGRLIAHSRRSGDPSRVQARLLGLASSGDPQLRAVWAAAQTAAPGSMVRLPTRDFLFVERVAGPDWRLLVVYPHAQVNAVARQSALLALSLGLAMLTVQAFALHRILTRRIARPVASLTASARRLAAWVQERGQPLRPDALPVDRRDEVGEMARAFAAMADRIVAEQSALEQKVAERTGELERLATTDDLTGLANRRSFIVALEDELARVARAGTPAALALFDVDHFKQINDRYGHGGGDAVLKTLAQRWMLGARDTDRCGRLGGEEFALLLVDTPEGSVLAAAERMRLLAQGAPVKFDGETIEVTISAGVTALSPDDTVKSALARADVALYRAKASGRDRTVLAADTGALHALVVAAVQ